MRSLITWKQQVQQQQPKHPTQPKQQPKQPSKQRKQPSKQRKRPKQPIEQLRKQPKLQRQRLSVLVLVQVPKRQEPAQALQLLLFCCKQRVQRRAGLPSIVFFS